MAEGHLQQREWSSAEMVPGEPLAQRVCRSTVAADSATRARREQLLPKSGQNPARGVLTFDLAVKRMGMQQREAPSPVDHNNPIQPFGLPSR